MKKKIVDFRVFIPNIVTLVAVCAGLTSIRFAFEGNFQLAMIAIVVSAILDGLDGQIARALKATSKFGAELDSLADVINFGVVPALILYVWDLKNFGDLGWLACLIYVISIVLRLARFNVMNTTINTPEAVCDTDQPIASRTYFIGVPAPIAAILALFPIYLSLSGGYISGIFSAIYVIIIAGFTVSTLKTYSLKSLRFNAKSSVTIMFCIASIAALLFSYTWSGLAILCILYLGYLIYQTLRLIGRGYRMYLLRSKKEAG